METKIVYQVEVRDASKFYSIIEDISNWLVRDNMEWVASDVIEVWSETLAEEIEYRLDLIGLPFTRTDIND